MGRGAGNEPVVAVNQVVGMLPGQCLTGGEHVLVHPLHPGHEAIEVAWPGGLPHAMDVHSTDLLGGPSLDVGIRANATREHIHCHSLADESLGELAHMPRQAALDHRRILPGEDQHTVTHSLDPICPRRNTPRQPHGDGATTRSGPGSAGATVLHSQSVERRALRRSPPPAPGRR